MWRKYSVSAEAAVLDSTEAIPAVPLPNEDLKAKENVVKIEEEHKEAGPVFVVEEKKEYEEEAKEHLPLQEVPKGGGFIF